MTNVLYHARRVDKGVYVKRQEPGNPEALAFPRVPNTYSGSKYFDIGAENNKTFNLAETMLLDALPIEDYPNVTREAVLTFARQVLATAPPDEFLFHARSVNAWFRKFQEDYRLGKYDGQFDPTPPFFVVTLRLTTGWSLLYYDADCNVTEIPSDYTTLEDRKVVQASVSEYLVKQFKPDASPKLIKYFHDHMTDHRVFNNGLVITEAALRGFVKFFGV